MQTLVYPEPMSGVPDHLRDGLIRYITNGTHPGHFLRAVLEHDLFESMARADLDSRAGLFGLVCFIYNSAPAGCHGNRERVEAWMEAGGLTGIREAP